MSQAKSMAMAYLRGTLEIFIKEIISKMNAKVMDRCIGLMEAITKETGIKVCKKEKVNIK